MSNKKYKSKLDKQQKKKKELDENLDYLKEVEKPGGRKFVVDTLKEEEREEKATKDAVKNYLESSVQAQFTYRRKLADYAMSRMGNLDFPIGWEYYAVPTDGSRIKIYVKWFKTEPGLLIILKSDKGEVFSRGIKTTQDPIYDVNAVDILILQVENTIDSSKGILLSDEKSPFKKTKSGIYIND